jgi:hypothetical protein
MLTAGPRRQSRLKCSVAPPRNVGIGRANIRPQLVEAYDGVADVTCCWLPNNRVQPIKNVPALAESGPVANALGR